MNESHTITSKILSDEEAARIKSKQLTFRAPLFDIAKLTSEETQHMLKHLYDLGVPLPKIPADLADTSELKSMYPESMKFGEFSGASPYARLRKIKELLESPDQDGILARIREIVAPI